MPLAPLILSVDTATRGGSVCISRGAEVLASTIGAPEVSHSNTLLRDINSCLEKAGVALEDVELFAATSGPGSFTGLRIGLATTKALAASLKRPCVGIPTLAAIARAAGQSPGTVALLPAGRGEAFVQMFSVSPDDQVVALDEPAHLSPQKMLARYGSFEKLKWAGEGAHLHRESLREHARGKGIEFKEPGSREGTPEKCWILAPEEKNLSRHLAVLALQAFERGKTGDAQSLHAIYVRPSDAELKCL